MGNSLFEIEICQILVHFAPNYLPKSLLVGYKTIGLLEIRQMAIYNLTKIASFNMVCVNYYKIKIRICLGPNSCGILSVSRLVCYLNIQVADLLSLSAPDLSEVNNFNRDWLWNSCLIFQVFW